VGVKNYRGQYGPSPLQHQADDIYRRYIDGVTAFVAWLLEHMYTVRLVIGDVSYDPQVLKDLRQSLNEREVTYESHQLIDEPIKSLEELVLQLATCDIVVSARFHNVVLGLLLNRPVIALSYHEKFFALMDSPDLAKYYVEIDHVDASTVIDKLLELQRHRDELTQHISRRVDEYRTALDEQYSVIFNDLWRK
jgi:polysaccharide pyruvyl transferase WcaK-like protein